MSSFRALGLALALTASVCAAAAGRGAASASSASDGPPGGPTILEGSRISLREARSRALGSSPSLDAARAVAAASAAMLRQARAWANPEIEMEVEEFGGDRAGWDEAEVTWTIAQRLEIFGTRGARTRAAARARDADALYVQGARRDLLADVDRRFAEALVAQERIEALVESDSIAGETVRAVTALVEAGEVSPIEVDRAETERSLVAVRLLTARFEHAGALRALAQLWGSSEPDFSGVRGSLEIAPALPDRESLFAALPETPDLLRADAEVSRAEAEVSLARRERMPEVGIRGGLRRFNASNEQSYVGDIGLTLPVLDRKDGTIEHARSRLLQARAERAALRSRIHIEQANAYDALRLALEASRSMREVSLPRARAIRAAVQEGYERGKFGLLDLIEARRSLLQVQLEYVDALRTVWAANVDLARLLGRGSIPDEGDSQ